MLAKMHRNRTRAVVLTLLASALLRPATARSAVFDVPAGDVPGLVAAIEAANANGEPDTINLAAGTYTLTVPYGITTAGLPSLQTPIAIVGAGAGATILERAPGAPDFALLSTSSDDARIEAMTLLRGRGGIRNSGTLTIADCTLTDNSYGLSNSNEAVVEDSTVTGSTSSAIGSSGKLTVRSSQIVANERVGIGSAGFVRVVDSLVQGNGDQGITATTGFPDRSAFVAIARSTIDGNGAAGILITNFYSGPAARVFVTDSTISNNAGSGIENYYSDEQEIVVRRSTISGNSSASHGGGISLTGAKVAPGGLVTVTVDSSTISGNRANLSGGGIFLSDGLRLGRRIRVIRSTITGNVADFDANGSGDGGGLVAPTPVIELEDSIVAGNSDAGGEAPDCSGTPVSRGHNLLGSTLGCGIVLASSDATGAPLLGPLAANGGPTATHVPLAGSPALDAADPARCGAPDQRSLLRPVDGDGDATPACDVGAVEADAATSASYESDHFVCRDAKPGSPALPAVAGVSLADEIESKSFDVRKTKSVCAPADANGEGVADDQTHLHARDVKESPGQPRHVRQLGIRLATQLGAFRVDTVKPERLLVPASLGVGAPAPAPNSALHDVDRFKCYKARLSSGSPALPRGATSLDVLLADGVTDGTVYSLVKLQRVCDAADENGLGTKNPGAWLVCFKASAKPPTLDGAPAPTFTGWFATSEFGTEPLSTRRAYELCIPAVRLP